MFFCILFFSSLLLGAQEIPNENISDFLDTAKDNEQSLATKTKPSESQEGIFLRDLIRIEGVRRNQLFGYGLVVGLAGTGDTRTKFASTSIQNLLGSLGQKIEKSRLNTMRNIAAVLVTAEIGAFARPGDRLSATVSSIGDARSLEGGILVRTPLYAGNKKIYAVAQGPLTVGRQTKNHYTQNNNKTVANLLNGVSMERRVDYNLLTGTNDNHQTLRISLLHFDFSTLDIIHKKIKDIFPNSNPHLDGGSLLLNVPQGETFVSFIARLEKLRVKPKYRSRIVINERSGTIVMGGNVQIDPVAISRNGMEIIVSAKQQDAHLGIKLDKQTTTSLRNQKTSTHAFSGTSVNELVEGLNAMGADVKDIVAILQALQKTGALHAELIVN